MIGKITSGADFTGTLKYDLDEEKGAKVLSFRGLYSIGRDCMEEIVTPEPGDIDREFNFRARKNPNVSKPVKHIALSWHPDDKIDEETMVKVAEEYLKLMEWDKTQYLITYHNKENKHVHICLNLVDDNGKRMNTVNDRIRNTKICRQLTEKYGFVLGASKAEKKSNLPAQTSYERYKSEIAARIEEVLPHVNTIEAFQRRFSKGNFECRIKKDKSGRSVGISFSIHIPKSGETYRYGGQKVGKRYTISSILNRINCNSLDQFMTVDSNNVPKLLDACRTAGQSKGDYDITYKFKDDSYSESVEKQGEEQQSSFASSMTSVASVLGNILGGGGGTPKKDPKYFDDEEDERKRKKKGMRR